MYKAMIVLIFNLSIAEIKVILSYTILFTFLHNGVYCNIIASYVLIITFRLMGALKAGLRCSQNLLSLSTPNQILSPQAIFSVIPLATH